MLTRLLIVAVGCAGCVLAQKPVATISSGENFEVNGVRVPVAGMPSWPVMAGDTISTGNAPAVISFGGRGRAVLSQNSKLQIRSEPDRLSVRLLQGGVSVRPERGPGLGVSAGGRLINAPAGSETPVALKGTTVVTGNDALLLLAPTPRGGTAAAKPKPTPTPTPTPPPPPSPK